MIEIKSIQGELLLSVPILEEAVSREELMTSDYVELSWRSDVRQILPVGSYIIHNGEKYSLMENYAPTSVNEIEYKYNPQFHSRIVRWQKTLVPIYTYEEDGITVKSRELDWTFTGSPVDAISMVSQASANELGEAWGVSMDAESLPSLITLSSQSISIWSLLSDIAEQCKTEWWVDKKDNLIYLGKCEHGLPVKLEVGKNVGVPSVTQNKQEFYTRFYAFGSTRNVTQANGTVQGSLVNKRLTLDPKKYPLGYKDIKGHFEGGVFVSDLLPEEVLTAPLYFEDIYPSSNLVISNVRKRMRYYLDDDGNKIKVGGTDEEPVYDMYAIWYFQIEGFEFSEELLIEGLDLSVHFKSGQLRGREFALAYHAEEKRVADDADVDDQFTVMAGDYEIIFDEQTEGFVIPSVDYIIPEDGDEITLFNIELPEEYTDSAMLRLEEVLDEEIERRMRDNNSYEFKSNPVAFNEAGTDLSLGRRVLFVNDNSELETRVLMVEKHLDFNFDQKIRVGNEIIVGSRKQLSEEVREVGREVNRMREQSDASAAIQREHTRDLLLNMSRFLAMKDTIGMLQNAVEGFSEGVTPVTVQTMALLVGDESLQFRFTNSREDLTPIDCPIVYDAETKQLNATASSLIHLTLGINTITAKGTRTAADFLSWEMDEWHSDVFEDASKKYYLYAVVETEGTHGSYVVSETPIKMRETEGVYHLLVGILNAEYVGERQFVTLYGFTEVTPAQITTDNIASADGKTWLDLLKGILHLNNMAGVSGVKTDEKGDRSIAAWFGGQMEDGELDKDAQNPAKIVLRHDGTGYFASGNIKWDDEGGAEFGGGDFKIRPDGSIVFGEDIKVSTQGDETLGTILNFMAKISGWFYETESGDIGTARNFFSEGEISAGGVGAEGSPESGGGGGATTLDGLRDVEINLKDLSTNQLLQQGLRYDTVNQIWRNKTLMVHHVQTSPQKTWYINHNLGKFPNVKVVDSLKQLCFADVYYIDENNVEIRFKSAESGNAYLD